MLNITAKILHDLADEIFSIYQYGEADDLLDQALKMGIIISKIATVEEVRRWDGCHEFELPFEDARDLETGEEYYTVCSEKEIEQMLKKKSNEN